MIVYLHGFNSSPQSHKAEVLRRHLQSRGCGGALQVPGLSHWPREAVAQAANVIEAHLGKQPICLVGSSLGGYYATWLAERYDLRAVLINPAVRPYRLLTDYLGTQSNPYTGEVYELTREHMAQLRALEVAELSEPRRFLVLLQTGDEVLDYRDALEFYASAHCRVTEGGDHAYRDFETVVEELLRFCGDAVTR
ncbi:MAG TPA: YqiA/YcfP family alpha/beta fold hydrolase [Gammaproteobacteria bacterium]|nr:YqiA/YcfP family alpha/beta fold hydrolase [Gammaproteobacteria bacterium]